MTVKRYDARIGNGMGLSVPCSEMYENPVCQFVTYSDYQKLVAENARMREAIEFATAPDMWQEQADGMFDYRYVDWYVDVMNAALEPKSTDAFTAELRAQGVDEFASSIGAEATGLSTSSKAYKAIKSTVFRAVNFAANLRAGRKG